MSIHRVAYVYCDGCRANDSADMADEGATATEQRRELKAMGWEYSAAGDLCPECHHERVADYVRTSRAAQGLPPTVSDEVREKVLRIIMLGH